MAKRIQQRATINGEVKWLSGTNQQELFESYLKHAISAGVVTINDGTKTEKPTTDVILFGKYLKEFVTTYKNKQSSLTMNNRLRIMEKHILPRLGAMPIDQVKTSDIQIWFDELVDRGYARETILKIKNTISPAFDSAVEDGLLSINPVKSKRLVINTHKGSHHKAIPPSKMMWVREHVHILPTREKRIVALLSYTGMRLEEVLGVCWNDFDFHAKRICVCRAVIHPTRNQPEVKLPKTTAGNRVIPLPDKLIELLAPLEDDGFVLGGEKPLTYQQQKRSFEKIRKTFGLEDYTAHDFRDTCATEWREAGMSIETISKMLGHANSTVTEKCYVKFREKSLDEARDIMNAI